MKKKLLCLFTVISLVASSFYVADADEPEVNQETVSTAEQTQQAEALDSEMQSQATLETVSTSSTENASASGGEAPGGVSGGGGSGGGYIAPAVPDFTDYDYVVDNMTFWSGKKQVDTLADASEVAVDVTRRTQGWTRDKIIISTYSADDKFLGMYTVSVYVEYKDTANIQVYMNVPVGEEVAVVKAYVWNGYDEMTPLSNTLSNSNNADYSFEEIIGRKTTVVKAEFIDYYDSASFSLGVYADENADKVTLYKLNKDASGMYLDTDVYVNGFYVGNSAYTINDYVIYHSFGDVELVDCNDDGYYDEIWVKSYVTALVDAVIPDSDTIVFKKMTTAGNLNVSSCLVLDEEENDELKYKILLDGEEIALSDIKENDVLSIECNVSRLDLDQCDDFVIYVSRNVKNGTYTMRDAEENKVTIGGEIYSFVNYSDMLSSDTLGSEYIIYLDVFNRIYKAEVNALAQNYAVVDMVLENVTGEYDGHRIRMFTAEGEIKTIVLEQDASVKIGSSYSITTGQLAAIQARVGSSMATRTAIQDRVVTYKVSNSTGYIKELTFLNAEKTTSNATDEYKADSNKLGSICFSDATKIIDARDYYKDWNGYIGSAKQADLKAISVSALEDEVGYTAYGFVKVDGKHSFVIITEGMAGYNEKTRATVITSSVSEGIDETTGETIYTVRVADSEEPLIISEDAKIGVNTSFTASVLNIGDFIVYKTDGNGYVNDIQILFSTYSQADDFTEIADEVISEYASVAIPAASKRTLNWTTDWTANPDPTEDTIRVMVGIVADKTDATMTLVAPDSSLYCTDLNGVPYTGVYELDLSDDTNVYTYDYNKRISNRVSKTIIDSIIPTILTDNCYADEIHDIIDWTVEQSRKNIKLAVVKTLGDKAVDVLYITGKYDTTNGAGYATANFEELYGYEYIFDKNVFDICENYTVENGVISANMIEISDWTEYSTVDAENDGYFVPVRVIPTQSGTMTVTEKLGDTVVSTKIYTTTANRVWDYIVRVAGTDEVELADEVEFTFTAAGATPVTYTFVLPEVY